MSRASAIMVVDDEKPLRQFVSRNLSARGFKIFEAASGLEAMAIFQAETLDLIVLDLMMPHMDGLAVTQHIRRSSTVPIIILSALDEEKDKVRALDMGADDYLTKPFGVEELLARVRVALRRSSWQSSPQTKETLEIGILTLDENRGIIIREGKVLKCTRTEFDLLAYFMRNSGKVLAHRLILQSVWGPEYGDETEYLRVYVGRLRRKIEPDAAKPTYLLTEHGIGYRFRG